jgi:hypothetical protein
MIIYGNRNLLDAISLVYYLGSHFFLQSESGNKTVFRNGRRSFAVKKYYSYTIKYTNILYSIKGMSGICRILSFFNYREE